MTSSSVVESLVQRVVERNLVYVSPQIFDRGGRDVEVSGGAGGGGGEVVYQYGMYDRSYGRYCQENPLESYYHGSYEYQCPVHVRYLPQIPLKKYFTPEGEYIYRVRCD